MADFKILAYTFQGVKFVASEEKAIVSVTYEYMRKDLDKNQLTSLKLCISSFLCGFRVDLWPFNGFYWNQFALTAFSIYEERQGKGKYIPYLHKTR